jgi:hypothetical protein
MVVFVFLAELPAALLIRSQTSFSARRAKGFRHGRMGFKAEFADSNARRVGRVANPVPPLAIGWPPGKKKAED